VCEVLGVSSDSIILGRNITQPPAVTNKKDTLMTLLNNATEDELSFLIEYVKLYRSCVVFK